MPPDSTAEVAAADEIKQQIRSYIAQNLLYSDEFPYANDASFLDNGIVDSAGVLDLVMFIEESFGLHIAGEDLTPDNFDSVDNLARYIVTRSGGPIQATAPLG